MHINPASTPVSLLRDICSHRPDEYSLSFPDHHRYRLIVGTLSYSAFCTRLDMPFTVSVLSWKLHDPSLRHLDWARRVVWYVSASGQQAINFSSSSCASMKAYFDCGWLAEKLRRSTTKIVITVDDNSVFWPSKSRNQILIALSSTEAGFIATSYRRKQRLWLRQLIRELWSHKLIKEGPPLPPTNMIMNSTVAIALTKNTFVSRWKTFWVEFSPY